jgi:hypothetical protein
MPDVVTLGHKLSLYVNDMRKFGKTYRKYMAIVLYDRLPERPPPDLPRPAVTNP